MFSSIILALLVLWLALLILVYVFQSRLIYFPEREITLMPADLGLPFEDIYLETRDGARIHGWFVPHPAPRATLLFLHGNAGNISARLDSVQRFYRMGLSVFIIDYHGYGHSSGSPGEQATYEDARAAWHYLIDDRRLPPERLLLFGRSLGGAVALWLASEYRPGALILESTFTSVADLGAELYPYLPVRWLARIRYPSLERMPGVKCPVLVVHSRDDEIIPYAHGRKLYQAATAPKQFLQLSGPHNDGYLRSGRKYTEGLYDFIYRYSGVAVAAEQE